MYITNTVMSLM